MGNQEIVSKLWNLCNVLRDDGITYHQYVTELTYILFLKMLAETGTEEDILNNIRDYQFLKDKENTLSKEERVSLDEKEVIASYTWEELVKKSGLELRSYYRNILRLFGIHCSGHIRAIYHEARSNIDEPKNLEKIVKTMNDLDWYSVDEEGFGDLYEGLLEKNANEKKSGAGQYFTPRVLIDVMTRLVKPQLGERCNDPACGTFGFMISANNYLKSQHNFAQLAEEDYEFQKKEALTGCELVPDTHRLAMMNAMIHGITSDIFQGDTLTNFGKKMDGFDVVLANPPFGTKKGGESATRDDFLFPTSNKQLNFLQHIYRSLKADGKARAAVVLPDNVLFADGDGTRIREDLMEKCNVHTVLRLPTGIFYAQGVKTNVLFFTRGTSEKGNTQEVWFYDMRTNMPSFGKTTPLKLSHFEGFETAYNAENRDSIKDERWQKFSREDIRQKGDSLDLGLIQDDSVVDFADLQDPVESGEEIVADLENAVDLIQSVILELKQLGGKG
ncbi:MAG: N-6 DNA methylase [Eubacteriales bacterium]